jgi:hypothetical protein
MAHDTITPTPAAPPEAVWDRAARILSGHVRAEDYLPVTPEVRRLTDREMEYGRARLKAHLGPDAEPTPEVERRQLKQNLLRVHYPAEHVGYIEDEHGVIVVVTGLDGTAEFLKRFPYELRKAVGFAYIDLY